MADKFLIIAATHGDENLGVEAMRMIQKKLSPTKYCYDWILGNPIAHRKGTRFIQADLNRVAPGNSNSKIYEERRAAELMEISKKYRFILDIHSTVSDSGIVTIIPYPTLENIYLASALNIKRNVIWYSSASFEKGPIVQFVGCPGIEIECGPKNSPKLKIRLYKILKKFIEESNLFSVQKVIDSIKSKEFYVVYGKETVEHNSTVKDFQTVKNGQETYYPFLSNQYSGIVCYKTKKFDVKQHLLYNS
jgi:hypothetical protein